MKINMFKISTALFFLALFFASCEKNSPTEIDYALPTEMSADNSWVEDEIQEGEELWFKVTCETTATTAYLEWAESAAMGEGRDYTGDVMISAYKMDGTTPYLEDKDNGYGDKSKSFALDGENEFLVKVTLGETQTPGTFALRATSTSDITIEYLDLAVGDTWTDSTIAVGEYIGFKVKYSGEKTYSIIWSEAGSPEGTHTADITGSVYKSDASTLYKDVIKGKDFLDKNKSHSDDPKQILTDANDNNFKIQIKGISAGTFAIKVVEVP